MPLSKTRMDVSDQDIKATCKKTNNTYHVLAVFFNEDKEAVSFLVDMGFADKDETQKWDSIFSKDDVIIS